jgi:membrane fusion protein
MSIPEESVERESRATALANGLFRRSALDAYYRRIAEPEERPMRVPAPRALAAFSLLAGLVGLGGVMATVSRMELTSRAPGALRTSATVRVLRSQVAGTVDEILVRSGQMVAAGAEVARLESPSLRTAFREAELRLGDAEEQLRQFRDQDGLIYGARIQALRRHGAVLTGLGHSLRQSAHLLERKVSAYQQLGERGAVGGLTVDEVTEERAKTVRQGGELQEKRADIELQIRSLESERQSELWRREADLRDRRARLEGLRISMKMLTIVATEAGYVEAVLVRPGDVLEAGVAIGRVVPDASPRRAVALIPERDRAFAEAGGTVQLEVEQLPYTEFGTLEGRIDRIAADVASAAEVRDVLGESEPLREPCYRVELTLFEGATFAALRPRLRPGMLVTARIPLRSRRAIGVLFDPFWRGLR